MIRMDNGPHKPNAGIAVGELASAHCYAADFGTVLEWCTLRTDALFHKRTPWDEAAVAYQLVRDARTAERRLGGEAA